MLLAAVTILSAAAIAYEILLMRLFSIAAWHHFAYMIISLALLGYGVSGTVIALARERLLSRFRPVFAVASIAFALLAPTAFILAQSLPFNPLEIYWDRGQLLWLAASYLLLALPFLCAATAIGLALSRAGPGVGRIYFADLVGAGAGAPMIIAALFYLPPEQCLKLITAAGGIAALVLFADARRRLLIVAVLLGGIAVAAPWPWLELKSSPYKSLAQILSVSGMTIADERPSPLGHVTVVEAGEVPLRHAPGLSLNAAAGIPDQVGIFIDGDGPDAITRFDGDLDRLAFLDQQTSALPYHLLQQPATLVLGAGGGSDVLRALYHRAGHIDAVELNNRIGEIMRTRYSAFSGQLYARPGVSFHVAEARSFLARGGRQYDLIQISLLDSFSAAAAGLYALNESTLYTLQAVSGMLRRLTPTGIVSITRWLRDPPRDSVRLFATAVAALRAAGVSRPGKRLMMIRSWDTATLLISNRSFDGDAITRARIFTSERGFDPVYYDGISPAEVNRRNVLREPYLYDAAIALLGPQAERFLDDYPYDISPTSDDRPYFFHTLKLAQLGTILSAAGPGRASLIEWGYVILWATLAQAVAASILLILLPIGVLPRTSAGSRLGNLVYFAALGLAFLFIEIAFIQRITLYLGHPLFAVVVVLTSFLVFAGLGSRASRALSLRFGARPVLCLAVTAIIALSLCYLVLFPVLIDSGVAAGTTALRIAVSTALISPLAFAMGVPFPLGLAALEKAPSLVPWAWGINGCASVISAALATLVAIEFGFTYVVIAASIFYLAAALAFPGVRRSSEQAP